MRHSSAEHSSPPSQQQQQQSIVVRIETWNKICWYCTNKNRNTKRTIDALALASTLVTLANTAASSAAFACSAAEAAFVVAVDADVADFFRSSPTAAFVVDVDSATFGADSTAFWKKKTSSLSSKNQIIMIKTYQWMVWRWLAWIVRWDAHRRQPPCPAYQLVLPTTINTMLNQQQTQTTFEFVLWTKHRQRDVRRATRAATMPRQET